MSSEERKREPERQSEESTTNKKDAKEKKGREKKRRAILIRWKEKAVDLSKRKKIESGGAQQTAQPAPSLLLIDTHMHFK